MSKFKTFAELQKAAAKLKPQPIKISTIVARTDTQIRTKTSGAQITEYQRVYQGEPKTKASGEPIRDEKQNLVFEPKANRMPPVILAPAADHQDENPDAPAERRFYCVDGDHRLTAASRAGLSEIDALVLPAMTLAEARFAAVGANAQHGLARTNADKRHGVVIALDLTTNAKASARKLKDGTYGKISYTGTLPNGEKLTARALAAVAGVSHETAALYMRELLAADFVNPKKAKNDKPSGNAKDDASGGIDPVDDQDDDAPRDLTSTEPTEYAHSLIVGASKDADWIRAVAETLQVWLDNNADAE